MLLRTLRSDASNHNESVKEADTFNKQTNNLLKHHTFLYIPLEFLHDYNMKMFYITACFMEDVKNQCSTNFASLSELG